jgi:DNA-binding Xre family transcriptional regulator
MNADLVSLVSEALAQAKKQGLRQKDVAKRSQIGEVGLSRLKKADDARFSTLQALGESVGLKLIWVADSSLAELVTKGELFD